MLIGTQLWVETVEELLVLWSDPTGDIQLILGEGEAVLLLKLEGLSGELGVVLKFSLQ